MKKFIYTTLFALLAFGNTSFAMQGGTDDLNTLREKEQYKMFHICSGGKVEVQKFDVSKAFAFDKHLEKEATLEFLLQEKKLKLIPCNITCENFYGVWGWESIAHQSNAMHIEYRNVPSIDDDILEKLQSGIERRLKSTRNPENGQIQFGYFADGFKEADELKAVSEAKRLEFLQKTGFNFCFWKATRWCHGVCMAVAQNTSQTQDNTMSVYVYGEKPIKFFREIAVLKADPNVVVANRFPGAMGALVSPKFGKLYLFKFCLPTRMGNKFEDVIIKCQH